MRTRTMVDNTLLDDTTMDALLEANAFNPFNTEEDDSMDALLKEAITEFEQCRIQLNKITERQHGRQHRSIEVSSSTPALKNLI